jgi:hypothetical protein
LVIKPLFLIAALIWPASVNAQSYPMVQCRIGVMLMATADFQCDAALRASRLLKRYEQLSVYPCAREMSRLLAPSSWSDFIGVCNKMFNWLSQDVGWQNGR